MPDGKEIDRPAGQAGVNVRDVPHAGYKVVGDKTLKLLTVHIVDKGKPMTVPRRRRRGAQATPLRLVPRDQLIGDVIESVADNMRLGTDAEQVVAGALDQRGFPTGGDRAQRIPGVAGDQAHVGGFGAELFLDITVSLARRLVVFDAVGAEAALEQIDDAAMRQLARLHFQEIVGQREQAEACAP